MQLVQAGQPFSLNYVAYNQDAGLDVAFFVYDVTTGAAVFNSTIYASHAGLGAYSAIFTGVASKTYLIIGAVYTSGPFPVIDTAWAPVADTYQVASNPVTFLPFNYATYDQNTSLYIQGSVYDMSSGTPVLVDQVVMDHVFCGVYFGSFVGVSAKTYAIASAVYDSSYTTPDPYRAAACENFDCISITGSSTILNVMQSAILRGQNAGSYPGAYPLRTALRISQGDSVLFNLVAENGASIPFDLTGAVFTTEIRGPGGTVVSFPNSQHTANPNQIGFTGRFTLALSAADTSSLAIGIGREIVTKVVQGSSTIYFHGVNILTVLASVPIE